ncbi:MAG: hypothetical protein AABW54_04055 [Candidatus Micrarchaeota archaeon]
MAQPEINMVSIPVEAPRTLMTGGKRWDYFERFQVYWFEYLRYRGAATGLAIAGLIALPSLPLATAVLWAGAAYCYQESKLRDSIVNMQRRIVQCN